MNLRNLTKRMEFFGDTFLYSPPDPYNIYERLAKIYLSANGKPYAIKRKTRVQPFDIFHYDQSCYDAEFRQVKPLHFLKWVLQALPEVFWKFNVYIDANQDILRKTAKDDAKTEVWVNMKDTPGKIKSATFNSVIMQYLHSGLFYLPSYKEICAEVSSWNKQYVYQYGDVTTMNVRLKGGDALHD